MGGHQSGGSDSEVWLTPRFILDAMGDFALDPCAAPDPGMWPTARVHYTREQNGLLQPWFGRVWLNPPYGGPTVIRPWLNRMAAHNYGTALIFARTETEAFHELVWRAASAILFLRGRLFFHRPDGVRAAANAGAPSCLVAYGDADAERLATCGLAGHFVGLASGGRQVHADLFAEAQA